MAFACFYNLADLMPLMQQVNRQDFAAKDRNFAVALWNAGLNIWQTAPIAPDQYRCVTVETTGEVLCDPDTRILVIDGNSQGQPIMLAQTVTWLRSLQSYLNVDPIVFAVADDMVNTAVEPWLG
jgi:hypothetical protein